MFPRPITKTASVFLAIGVGVAIVSAGSKFADAQSAEKKAQTGEVIPPYAYKVAEGSPSKRSSWGIWVFGRRGDQCWGIRNVDHRLVDDAAYCGFQVPTDPWQLAARGSYTGSKGPRSLLFFLTRRSIKTLKVEVKRFGSRPTTLSMNTKRLTSSQAQRANMQPSFGYAFEEFEGQIDCISRITATDSIWRRVASSDASKC